MPPLTSFALLNFINARHPTHLLLSTGTRIVTRSESNRIGGGPVIPAGSVAVILDAPADAQHAYKIRTNDGSEAMLRRTEFSILKEFKSDEAIGRESSVDSDFDDWTPFIVLYVMSQFKKLEQDLRARAEIKWKHTMHLLAFYPPVSTH